MPETDIKLGNKHTCSECNSKFYDFGRPNPVCPKCQSPLKAKPSSLSSSRSRADRHAADDLDDDVEIVDSDADLDEDLGDDEAEDFDDEK